MRPLILQSRSCTAEIIRSIGVQLTEKARISVAAPTAIVPGMCIRLTLYTQQDLWGRDGIQSVINHCSSGDYQEGRDLELRDITGIGDVQSMGHDYMLGYSTLDGIYCHRSPHKAGISKFTCLWDMRLCTKYPIVHGTCVCCRFGNFTCCTKRSWVV